MRSLQDEIRQAQRDLFCPICSRTFELKDIQLHSFPDKARLELSVVCNRGHFPVILLVPVLCEATKAGAVTQTEARLAGKRISELTDNLLPILGKKR